MKGIDTMTMTRKDYFNELLNIQEVAENEELVIFINKELAKLEKRSNTQKKPTKKQIENLLDMWLSSAQLEAIKEGWKAFYENPSAYKGTIVVTMVKQFVDKL